jgi:hypothetical protein
MLKLLYAGRAAGARSGRFKRMRLFFHRPPDGVKYSGEVKSRKYDAVAKPFVVA